MNILLDNNILIDILSPKRGILFKSSATIYEMIHDANGYDFYMSSSSLDNIEYILMRELKSNLLLTNKQILKIVHLALKKLLTMVKIAKTPSYIEIDYDDIEDSQIIASAKAIDAKIITRDNAMLEKYSKIAISPEDFLKQKVNNSIDFANLKKQYFNYQAEIEKKIDQVCNSASFIMGEEVTKLEESLQSFTSAKYAITCSSGTDALMLAMMALDIEPGDEVITAPFTGPIVRR